ncbi:MULTISPECIES: right-handed parallel beta-helix repeat-containing protein [Methylococcus]|jgi:hypothetical protein|uniref:right-handed parallel beta-helix repeat-containing protein n=1 Tax=Methylococcus TaxID=413 RepID=UPI0002D9B78A|nr:right-handed parallel beta-helix repeat-containing protein [Methylococcus capsulatus]
MLKHGLLFALFLLAAPALGAPQIFWASDPVKPGEAALMVGDGFGEHPRIELTRLKDDAGGAPASPKRTVAGASVEPLQASDQSVKFIIPAEFEDGVYAARITNANASTIGLLNAPTVYWAQGDQGVHAAPGGWIRVFGRCIGHAPASAVLLLNSVSDRTSRRLAAASSSPWEARFEVPADMKPGAYDLHLHSGAGDSGAWSPAGRLEIKAAEHWPERQFDVRDFGATGAGSTDDTQAVLAAVKTAGDLGGGVVYFPRGRYLLTQALILPRFVTLRGERRDRVNLLWPDMEQPPAALIQGSNHFALEDLTLYASNHTHLIAGDLQATPAGEPGHVRIQRVTARADVYRGHLKPEQVDQRFRESLKLSTGGGDTLRLGGEHLVITDNDLYGSGRALYLFKPKGAYVANNHFYNGRWGWYCLSGVNGLIFEDNQITGADLMSTGGGINNLGGTPYSQNVFFARNRLSLMHGWDREAMTSDAGGGLYYGPLKDIRANAFAFTAEPTGKRERADGWKGAGVFILGGKGMGQFAQIDHIDGDSVHLDRPWKVPPDGSSVVTVTGMQQHYMFIANDFSDASVALSYYGTSIDNIAAGNKSTRTAGFYNSGMWYLHYQPSWYCQFFDNEILEGNNYHGGLGLAQGWLSGEASLGTRGNQKPPNTAPLALAAVHRRNHLYSNAHLLITGGGNRAAPGTRDVIVENNTVENADVGLQVDAGVVGLLEHGNVFNQVKEPFRAPPGSMLRVQDIP